jgi:arabinan endo-1,5-alpha-L-arabinosidase
MRKRLIGLFGLLISTATIAQTTSTPEHDHYTNPVIGTGAPDPSVLRAADGMFYLSSGAGIWKSPNLTDWTFARMAFDGAQDPGDGHLGLKGEVWASDLNYINGKYVMYFSISVWGGEWDSGICVATSDNPDGPYSWQKKLFSSKEVSVQNSIDPFYIEDNGRKYLFWGSFSGIFGVELSDDGLSVVGEKRQIAGGGWPEAIEGTCIYKRNGYYYLIGSRGACCEGLESTYNLGVARSENLFGPYTDRHGGSAMFNCYEPLLQGNDRVKGPGHCSEVIVDDNGQTWLCYHGWDVSRPDAGRVCYLDRLDWIGDWPDMGTYPTTGGVKPVISHR